MANTGDKQATIAYKVSRPGGIPLDINGDPVSESGLRQAIALLTGYTNPDPLLYEVQTYFNIGGFITGNPTQVYDPAGCPVGFLLISPAMLVLTPENPSSPFSLYSANAWHLVSGPTTSITVSPTLGNNGSYEIVATRTAVLGQGYFIFEDNITGQQASIYIVNTDDPTLWVLDGGTWHMLGFWFDNEIWNF